MRNEWYLGGGGGYIRTGGFVALSFSMSFFFLSIFLDFMMFSFLVV